MYVVNLIYPGSLNLMITCADNTAFIYLKLN